MTVERWRVARIASVRPLVTVSGDHSTAVVAVYVDIETVRDRFSGSRLAVMVRLGEQELTGRVAAGASVALVEVTVASPPCGGRGGTARPPCTTSR